MNRHNPIVYAVRSQLNTQPRNRLNHKIHKQLEELLYE